METVNSIASAASRAIWGESSKGTTNNETKGTEPMSGQTGNVEAGEPYDKGNEGEPNTSSATTTNPTTTSSTTDSSNTTNLPNYLNYQKDNINTEKPSTNTNPSSTMAGNAPVTAAVQPEQETAKTGAPSTSTSSHDPSLATSTTKPSSSNDNSGAGPTLSISADPSSTAQDTGKHQGAEKPMSEPSSETENEAVKDRKDDYDDSAATGGAGRGDGEGNGGEEHKEHKEHKGDGIITEGGDMNKKVERFGEMPTNIDEKNDGRLGPLISGSEGGEDVYQSKGSAGMGGVMGVGKSGVMGGHYSEVNEPSHSEGMGKEWIKSTGTEADGGDFDASKAGAGREADRLMEDKGINHDTPGSTETKETTAKTMEHESKHRGHETSSSGKDATEHDTGKEKLSLKDKIKAKLHVH